MSNIQRSMKRIHDDCALITGSGSKKCISRVQLTRILEDADYSRFNLITERFFGFAVFSEMDRWRALDGKELRGSIDSASGDKRGESVVLETHHNNKESSVIGYYSATKDSEKNILNNYFNNQDSLKGRRFTLDALHNGQGLLSEIEKKQGIYLVQIKANQKHLFNDLKHIHQHLQPSANFETVEKGHGRVDRRQAFVYPANIESLEPRWSKSGIQTLICIVRHSFKTKNCEESKETSYYVSNLKMKGNEAELFNAVRNHWAVEANNWIRDVNLGEDYLRCSKPGLLKFISSVFTAIINGLIRLNSNNNLKELREDLAHKPIGDCDFFMQ